MNTSCSNSAKSSLNYRHEEIMEVIKNMHNHKKIKDVSRVLSSFEELTRSYSKGKNVLDVNDRPPRFYIRAIVELEDFVNEVGACVVLVDKKFCECEHQVTSVSCVVVTLTTNAALQCRGVLYCDWSCTHLCRGYYLLVYAHVKPDCVVVVSMRSQVSLTNNTLSA